MKTFAACILACVTATTVHAGSFGDDVVRCIVGRGVSADSPVFGLTMSACETIVQRARNERVDLLSACKTANSDASEQQIAAEVCVKGATMVATEKMFIAPRRDAWAQCLAMHISTLDDGVSPASDIATAVQNSCADEYESLSSVISASQGLKTYADPGTQEHVMRRKAATREVALPIVLRLRASKRVEPTKKAAPRISG